MLCLFVHMRGFPFKNHVYVVLGIPKAIQGMVTVVFDPAVVCLGFRIHSGLAVENKSHFLLLKKIHTVSEVRSNHFDSKTTTTTATTTITTILFGIMKRRVVSLLSRNAGCTKLSPIVRNRSKLESDKFQGNGLSPARPKCNHHALNLR